MSTTTDLDQATRLAKRETGSSQFVWIMLCLSAIGSWTVWLWPVKRPFVTLEVLGWRFSLASQLFMQAVGVCLPGVIAVLFSLFESKQQLRSLLRSVVTWRVPFVWYLLAAGIPSAVFLISVSAVLFYFPAPHSLPPLSSLLWAMLLTFPGCLCEELAWRAYAFTKLQVRYSPLRSAVIVGVYWAGWHIPLWLQIRFPTMAMTVVILLMTAVVVVGLSLINGFLYNRSGYSLPIVVLLHVFFNAGSDYAGIISPWNNLLIITFYSALFTIVAVSLSRRLAGSTGSALRRP